MRFDDSNSLSLKARKNLYRSLDLRGNPFNPGELRGEQLSLLVGRQKEAGAVINALADDANALIYGLKGVGKSTFLNFINATLKNDRIIVTSVEGIPHERSFFLNILECLLRENMFEAEIQSEEDQDIHLDPLMPLGQWQIIRASLDAEKMFGFKSHYKQKIKRKPSLFETLKKKIEKYRRASAVYTTHDIVADIKNLSKTYSHDFPIVVCVDNFHKIAALKSTVMTFQETLAKEMFSQEIKFVVAGTPATFKSIEHGSSLLDRFPSGAQIALKPLNVENVRLLIQKRIDAYRLSRAEKVLSFDDEAIDLIAKLSDGYPRRVVDACNACLRFCVEKSKLRVTEEIAHKTLKNLGLLIPQKIYSSLSRETRDVYKTLLSMQPTGPAELANEIGKSKSTIFHHLKILVDAGLVKKTPWGEYRVSQKSL